MKYVELPTDLPAGTVLFVKNSGGEIKVKKVGVWKDSRKARRKKRARA